MKLVWLVRLVGLVLQVGQVTRHPHAVYRVSDPIAKNPVESSVAIDPGNRDHMIAVSYQTGFAKAPRTTGYIYVSHDGGRTWRNERAANPLGRTQGDDVVTFAGPGVALHTYISFLGIRVPNPPRAETGIFVTRTDDAGVTWNNPVAAIDHANTVLPFEDKPWIAADGAKTFAMPRPISDSPGDCIDSDNTVEGAVPAVGNGDPDVFVIKSRDGGTTFANHAVDIPDFEVSDTVTFGDYLGVDARDGRVAGVFPHIVDGNVILSAAIFDFR